MNREFSASELRLLSFGVTAAFFRNYDCFLSELRLLSLGVTIAIFRSYTCQFVALRSGMVWWNVYENIWRHTYKRIHSRIQYIRFPLIYNTLYHFILSYIYNLRNRLHIHSFLTFLSNLETSGYVSAVSTFCDVFWTFRLDTVETHHVTFHKRQL